MSETVINSNEPIYVKVAVPVPLFSLFDYKLPKKFIDLIETQHSNQSLTKTSLQGCRVEIPFGRKSYIATIVQLSNSSEYEAQKVKEVTELIDTQPIIDPNLFQLVLWVSNYYHYPLGEVFKAALPSYLTNKTKSSIFFRVLDTGFDTSQLNRSPAQKKLFEFIRDHAIFVNHDEVGVDEQIISNEFDSWKPILKKLMDKNLVAQFESLQATELQKPKFSDIVSDQPDMELNALQSDIYTSIKSNANNFQPSTFNVSLIHGITGSGKTRIYLNLIADVVNAGYQCLILVPEISLTPQIIERVKNVVNQPVEILHSSRTSKQRRNSWEQISLGASNILIGTRSAIFTPFKNLGMIIIDEEHDHSYKQHDSFRFHARDVALVRAQKLNVPVVLGSATPSLETMLNSQHKYTYLPLLERAGNAIPPKIHLIDIKNSPQRQGLTPHLIQAINDRLEKKEQILIFLNRRGYAPVLMCGECQWIAECKRCHAKLTIHHQKSLDCHHCGAHHQIPQKCPKCTHDKLAAVGEGTQRLEEHLDTIFPNAKIARLDRDQTSKKNHLEAVLASIQDQEVDIIIGTQMLAKGHDFPNVTLVGIVNPDGALFSSDFRATESMMQLLIQVAGRSGRGNKQGQVLIQTAYPENKYFQYILNHDYTSFSEVMLKEREDADLPPYTSMAIFRAEAPKDMTRSMAFLNEIYLHSKSVLESKNIQTITVFKPLPSTMEKRQGVYRGQWIINSQSRQHLQNLLGYLVKYIETLDSAKKVRWSVDVDPLDTF